MKHLTLATLSSENPMGQQVYEEQVASRSASALGPEWSFRRATVRSLRSSVPGTVRLPARTLSTTGPAGRRLAGLVAYGRPDVVHRMDLRLPPAWGTEVLTILDAVSWRFPDEARPPAAAAAEARRSARVVCPSTFSAEELTALLDVKNVVVIPLGVDPGFSSAQPLGAAELSRLGVTPPFVLHAGGSTSRKNLAALAEAWPIVRRSRPDLTLVLMGSRDARKEQLFARLEDSVLIGRQDDPTARSVMASATAVVVPSVYEGFGLPALEAMAAGAPVVAARRSSLPEVCGDAANLVEPTADGLAGGILEITGDETAARDLVQRGRRRAADFTWERCVARHAEVWQSV